MEIRQEEPEAAGRNKPQPYCDFWEAVRRSCCYLLSIEAGAACQPNCAVTARAFSPGGVPKPIPMITVDISGSESTCHATGDRHRRSDTSRGVVRPGSLRLVGSEGSIDITGDLPGIPASLSSRRASSPPNKLGIDIDESAIGALKYESAFEDPLLTEIAYAIASELQTETSAGSLLVESLASTIAARLVQKHASTSPARSYPLLKTEGLDRRRLLRVLDYIEANLEGDLSIDRMASIACLSRYHFARAFRQAVGQPPHRYVSARRLERAKALLTRGDRPLVDIALSLGFSGQANFTRAFRQATGQAPGRYRQTAGSRRSEFSLTDVRRSLPILA